jgi:tRNA 2-thiouridine synthesizing protein A
MPQIVDTTGLTCPMPFLKLRRVLKSSAAGTQLLVLSTDDQAPGDFRELCDALGHHVVSQQLEGTVTRTLIEVSGPARGTGS